MAFKISIIFKFFVKCECVEFERFWYKYKTSKKSSDLPKDFVDFSLSEFNGNWRPSLQSQVSLYHKIKAIPREFTKNRISKARAQRGIPAVVFSQPPSKIVLSPPVDRSIDRQKTLVEHREEANSIHSQVYRAPVFIFCSRSELDLGH